MWRHSNSGLLVAIERHQGVAMLEFSTFVHLICRVLHCFGRRVPLMGVLRVTVTHCLYSLLVVYGYCRMVVLAIGLTQEAVALSVSIFPVHFTSV